MLSKEKSELDRLIKEFEEAAALEKSMEEALLRPDAYSEQLISDFQKTRSIAREKKFSLHSQIDAQERALKKVDPAYNKNYHRDQLIAARKADLKREAEQHQRNIADKLESQAKTSSKEASKDVRSSKQPLWLRKDKDRDRGR